MGKAQSKRSVDITTETKKGPDGADEVTGKLEKIEDIDQKQVNGDATPQEKNDAAGEKKDAPDETENEKDLTTEKTAAETTATATATPSPTNGSGDQATNETSPKEDESCVATATTTAAPAQEGEEITPLADESLNKKSKKEKVKKKWSFRSISFGKKDKQKPAKTEGSENAAAATSTAENAAAVTNGDASETNQPAEVAAADATKQDDATAPTADEAKPVEADKIENDVGIVKEPQQQQQQQMNGQKTPTPTDDAEEKKPIETSTAVVNETATAAAVTTAVTTPAPAPASSSNETANNESHVDVKTPIEKVETVVVSNGTAADAEKNGDVHANEHVEKTAQSEDNNKSIPVDEKPHQNGTNGDEGVEEITAATKTLQIEVKIEHQIDNVNSTTTTTTTTTIPADNFNTEQKTTTDNLFITSAQTDIHTTNTTNTTDKSLSSNNSIAIIEEQSDSQPNKALDTFEVISKVSVEAAENNPNQSNEDPDAPQQQQQQQQQPPPLPLSAPPSQVIIFALKDNENSSDDVSAIALEHNEENVLKTLPEASIKENAAEIEVSDNDEFEIVTETVKITTDKENSVDDVYCLSENVTAEPKNSNSPVETEIIEIIASMGDEPTIAQETTAGALDDFAAEALIIVDQIQKDLEQEDDDSAQQDTESERSLNVIEKLNNIACTTDNIEDDPESLIEMVSSLNIENNIPETVVTTSPNSNESTETFDVVEEELRSVSKNEINLPIKVQAEEEIGQRKIEIENIELSEQKEENENENENENETSDPISYHNNEELIQNNENIIEITQDQSDKEEENCSLKSENIKSLVVSDEKINVIDINDKDDELIVSLNKEIPTAKDLKENAAAAEITTQDLPVTCE